MCNFGINVEREIEKEELLKSIKKDLDLAENNKDKKFLVTGAGGFIGSNLVTYLKKKGYWVRGVDIREPIYRKSDANEFLKLDLRDYNNCCLAIVAKTGKTEEIGVDYIFHLAADMGGVGYINEKNLSKVYRNNSLIDINMLDASIAFGVKKFLFSSSACAYNIDLQKEAKDNKLKESDVLPAKPDQSYGWEKLMMEMLCEYYMRDYGLQTYVARFHNIYGINCVFDGGKEKSPAAICRKVIKAKEGENIEIWGDGKQVRSYCYIDDCIEGLYRIISSDYHKPLNLGNDRAISINDFVDLVCNIEGKKLNKLYKGESPQGVRGRNSDNTLIKQVLGWSPKISLESGIKKTYNWIKDRINNE